MKESPVSVKLLAMTDGDPIDLIKHAASKCSQGEPPVLGGESKINVKDQLFDKAHHTTMEHSSMIFDIEGIAVGDITAGLHLVNPFYNSDQRSGRFCSKMFLEPDFEKIENYIRTFWPEVSKESLIKIMEYVQKGLQIFHDNIDEVTKVTTQIMREERPFLSEEKIKDGAKKIAQEQTRTFIPVVSPTGLDFTIDFITLASMYRAAWTPVMKQVTQQMVDELLKVHPQMVFMFDPEVRRGKEWGFSLREGNCVKTIPYLEVLSGADEYDSPNLEDTFPVDLLHYLPELMDNSIRDIHTFVEMSFATMGQDQRHRTIRRGIPNFTGDFFLTEVLMQCGLEGIAQDYLEQWKYLRGGDIPRTLFTAIAPYGAMVSYSKKGSLNAITHEQGKRLCWCAQSEIYDLGRRLRYFMVNTRNGSKFSQMFEPPCFQTGKCAEGKRYCGRDLSLEIRNSDDFFPKRKV